ncbi:helix-turn-helix domain-containing protein [Arthrobacter rhombi]|uniref:helix-turn-helix domain-containing protein n=1 Tax=Arthrobacter rhombi TaxID=71253 RepID=UPI003FD0EBC4
MTAPKQRSASKTTTQQRIVDAAFALLRQHGYEATALSQIARETETSRPHLYLHFASKTQIVLDRMKAS